MEEAKRYQTKGGHNKKMTPKQIAYLAYYNDPTSPTYCNALQSALRAGYSQKYAESITSEGQRNQWMDVGENFRKELLQKAEQNLMKIVNMSEDKLENPTMAKMWQDTNKFVSERLGKENYSARQELTDKGGRRLFTDKEKDTASIPLSKLFKVAEQDK